MQGEVVNADCMITISLCYGKQTPASLSRTNHQKAAADGVVGSAFSDEVLMTNSERPKYLTNLDLGLKDSDTSTHSPLVTICKLWCQRNLRTRSDESENKRRDKRIEANAWWAENGNYVAPLGSTTPSPRARFERHEEPSSSARSSGQYREPSSSARRSGQRETRTTYPVAPPKTPPWYLLHQADDVKGLKLHQLATHNTTVKLRRNIDNNLHDHKDPGNKNSSTGTSAKRFVYQVRQSCIEKDQSIQQLSNEVQLVQAQLQEPLVSNQNVLSELDSKKSQAQRLLGQKDSEITRLMSEVSSLMSSKTRLEERLAASSAAPSDGQMPALVEAQRTSDPVDSKGLSLGDVQSVMSSQLAPLFEAFQTLSGRMDSFETRVSHNSAEVPSDQTSQPRATSSSVPLPTVPLTGLRIPVGPPGPPPDDGDYDGGGGDDEEDDELIADITPKKEGI
eukprot:s690_g27.t1